MENTLSPVVKSFLAGMLSGSCSTVLFQPLDLVKTRIQTAVPVGGATGMVTVMNTVVQQDRLLGLWKGLTPSFTRAVPGIAIYFSSVHTLRSNFGSEKPKALESALTGATARAMSGVIVIPFTVLKTRYESGKFCYEKGLRGALFTTYKTEGFRALHSGLSPTLMRDVPFSGLYLMFYTRFKQIVNERNVDKSFTPLLHFLCGINAGALAAVITQPADVVKTHMQMNPKVHSTVRDTVRFVYQMDGIEGFLRGIIPRTIRRTLMAAMAWTIYDEVAKKYGLK